MQNRILTTIEKPVYTAATIGVGVVCTGRIIAIYADCSFFNVIYGAILFTVAELN